jgi:hypothetical protein
MSHMKALSIEKMNEEMTPHSYKVQTIGEFMFPTEREAAAFRGRFLEFLTHEKNIYILEKDMDVTLVTKEYKRSYGNIIEIPSKQTRMRV